MTEYKIKINKKDIELAEKAVKRTSGELKKISDNEFLIKLEYDENSKEINKVIADLKKECPSLAVQLEFQINEAAIKKEQKKLEDMKQLLNLDEDSIVNTINEKVQKQRDLTIKRISGKASKEDIQLEDQLVTEISRYFATLSEMVADSEKFMGKLSEEAQAFYEDDFDFDAKPLTLITKEKFDEQVNRLEILKRKREELLATGEIHTGGNEKSGNGNNSGGSDGGAGSKSDEAINQAIDDINNRIPELEEIARKAGEIITKEFSDSFENIKNDFDGLISSIQSKFHELFGVFEINGEQKTILENIGKQFMDSITAGLLNSESRADFEKIVKDAFMNALLNLSVHDIVDNLLSSIRNEFDAGFKSNPLVINDIKVNTDELIIDIQHALNQYKFTVNIGGTVSGLSSALDVSPSLVQQSFVDALNWIWQANELGSKKNKAGDNTLGVKPPERILYFNTETGQFSNPSVLGHQTSVSKELQNEILKYYQKQGITFDTFLHTHEDFKYAAPSREDGDLSAFFAEAFHGGLNKFAVMAQKEIAMIDFTKIASNATEFSNFLKDYITKNIHEIEAAIGKQEGKTDRQYVAHYIGKLYADLWRAIETSFVKDYLIIPNGSVSQFLDNIYKPNDEGTKQVYDANSGQSVDTQSVFKKSLSEVKRNKGSDEIFDTVINEIFDEFHLSLRRYAVNSDHKINKKAIKGVLSNSIERVLSKSEFESLSDLKETFITDIYEWISNQFTKSTLATHIYDSLPQNEKDEIHQESGSLALKKLMGQNEFVRQIVSYFTPEEFNRAFGPKVKKAGELSNQEHVQSKQDSTNVQPNIDPEFQNKLQDQISKTGEYLIKICGDLIVEFKSRLQNIIDETGEYSIDIIGKLIDKFRDDLQDKIDNLGPFPIEVKPYIKKGGNIEEVDLPGGGGSSTPLPIQEETTAVGNLGEALRETAEQSSATTNEIVEGMQEVETATSRCQSQINDVVDRINKIKAVLPKLDEEGIVYKYLIGDNGDAKSAQQLLDEIKSETDEISKRFYEDSQKGIVHSTEEYMEAFEEVFRKIRAGSMFYGRDIMDQLNPMLSSMYGSWSKTGNPSADAIDRINDDAVYQYSTLIELQKQLALMQRNDGEDYVEYYERALEIQKKIQAAEDQYRGLTKTNVGNLKITQEEADQRAEAIKHEREELDALIQSSKEYIEAHKEFYNIEDDYNPLGWSADRSIKELEEASKMLEKEEDAFRGYTRIQRGKQADIFDRATEYKFETKSNAPKELEEEYERLSTAIMDGMMSGKEAIEAFNQKADELGYTFNENLERWTHRPIVKISSTQSAIDEITKSEDKMGNEAQESTDQARQGLAKMREEAEKTDEVIVESQEKAQEAIGDTNTLLRDLRELLRNLNANNLRTFDEAHGGILGISDDNLDEKLERLKDIKQIITKLTRKDPSMGDDKLLQMGIDDRSYESIARKIPLLEKLGYTVSEIREGGSGYEADIIPIPDKAITNAEDMLGILFDIKEQSQDLAPSTQPSTDGLDQESKGFQNVKDNANETAKAKEDFSKANAEVLDSIVKSLDGLNKEGKLFENLNQIIKKLGSDKNIDVIVKNIERLRDVLKESVPEDSFINALKDLAKEGESLKPLAAVLSQGVANINKAKNATQNKSTVNQDAVRENIKKQIEQLDYALKKNNPANEMKSSINELIGKFRAFEGLDIINEKDVDDIKALVAEAGKLKKELGLDDNKQANQRKVQSLLGDINQVLSNNSNRRFKKSDQYQQLFELQEILKTFDASKTKKKLDEVAERVIRVLAEVKGLDSSFKGNSFFEKFTNRLSDMNAKFLAQYFSWRDILRYMRTLFDTIKDLDTQIVDLRKTTSMNNVELETFYEDSASVAKGLGVTTSEIIQQASAWSRLNKIGPLYGNV